MGDYVLAAPGHACTMTVKFPFTHVVSNKGDGVWSFNHDAEIDDGSYRSNFCLSSSFDGSDRKDPSGK
ncbi:MAG: hypothetical protein CM1200mP3_13560 [Chloroflexota bacterium]|nr:MAG: hypothetical protein CM1200mP3_13560 [Chloroflexota bacterium]